MDRAHLLQFLSQQGMNLFRLHQRGKGFSIETDTAGDFAQGVQIGRVSGLQVIRLLNPVGHLIRTVSQLTCGNDCTTGRIGRATRGVFGPEIKIKTGAGNYLLNALPRTLNITLQIG